MQGAMEGWAEFTRDVQQYYGVDMACLGDQFRREQKGALALGSGLGCPADKAAFPSQPWHQQSVLVGCQPFHALLLC